MKLVRPISVCMVLGWLIGVFFPNGLESAPEATEEIKVYSATKGEYVLSEKVSKSEAGWRGRLTPEQYRILREKGTERAYTGKYWNHYQPGIYRCAGCGLDLFESETKYKSKTGWPSFFAPVAPENIQEKIDFSLIIPRTEVLCARCGGHLGHVFGDGPEPTGQRYCINSEALEFIAKPNG